MLASASGSTVRAAAKALTLVSTRIERTERLRSIVGNSLGPQWSEQAAFRGNLPVISGFFSLVYAPPIPITYNDPLELLPNLAALAIAACHEL